MPVGMAQKRYLELGGKSFWKNETGLFSTWPFLEMMQRSKQLHPIDLFLAKRVLSFHSSLHEAAAAFLCHLSQAARLGHLCIQIDGEQIHPSPEEIWGISMEDESDYTLSKDDARIKTLDQLIKQGANSFPDLLLDTENPFPVCKNGKSYYFQRNWHLETTFIKHLQQFLAFRESRIKIDLQKIKSTLTQMQQCGFLQAEQAMAIETAAGRNFTLITGGPGTGKTYTAGVLLRLLLSNLEQEGPCRILLAAPTGKAVANLEGSIRRCLESLEEKHQIEAKTLHALLYKTQSFYAKGAQRKFSSDILLIDECSMIDIEIMAKLMEAVQTGTKMVMQGDPDQLPSVEAGSLFADLIASFQYQEADVSPIVQLTKCVRVESQELVNAALTIKNGDASFLLERMQHSVPHQPLYFRSYNKMSGFEVHKELLITATERFPHVQLISEDPIQLFDAYSKFRVLTPLRKGPLGVEEINASFYAHFFTNRWEKESFIVPIIITKNDYKLELFNGEMGLLVKSFADNNEYAIFLGRQEEKIRKFSAPLLPPFEYAYALSIHKSQGSEFDSVILILPEGVERFGREALYTGVTRARRSLEIWSSPETINKMIHKRALRLSGVKERINMT